MTRVEREGWVTWDSWPTCTVTSLEDGFVQILAKALRDNSQLILKHFFFFHILTSPKFMAYHLTVSSFFFWWWWYEGILHIIGTKMMYLGILADNDVS